VKPGDLIQVRMGNGIGVMYALYVEPEISSMPPFLPTGAHECWISWQGRLRKMRFLRSALVEQHETQEHEAG
jgi:hypothetical protein